MKATLLLADAAQIDTRGKVHALGMGWTTVTTPTPPMAVILLLEIGWDETNKKIETLAQLVDADGHAVTMPGPLGDQPIQIAGDLEVGRPPGLPAGTPISTPLATTINPGIQLIAGQRYEWRLSINGQTRPEWCASFLVHSGG